MKERHNQLISKGGTKANHLPLLLLLLLNQNTMKCKDNPNISQSWHNQYISVEEAQGNAVVCITTEKVYGKVVYFRHAAGDTLLSVFGFCCCYTK